MEPHHPHPEHQFQRCAGAGKRGNRTEADYFAEREEIRTVSCQLTVDGAVAWATALFFCTIVDKISGNGYNDNVNKIVPVGQAPTGIWTAAATGWRHPA